MPYRLHHQTQVKELIYFLLFRGGRGNRIYETLSLEIWFLVKRLVLVDVPLWSDSLSETRGLLREMEKIGSLPLWVTSS